MPYCMGLLDGISRPQIADACACSNVPTTPNLRPTLHWNSLLSDCHTLQSVLHIGPKPSLRQVQKASHHPGVVAAHTPMHNDPFASRHFRSVRHHHSLAHHHIQPASSTVTSTHCPSDRLPTTEAAPLRAAHRRLVQIRRAPREEPHGRAGEGLDRRDARVQL